MMSHRRMAVQLINSYQQTTEWSYVCDWKANPVSLNPVSLNRAYFAIFIPAIKVLLGQRM
jgi:hypothetical protein